MRRQKLLILIIFLTSLILVSGCEITEVPETQKILEQSVVSRVIDGDTIELANGEKIRLLHINTAERGEKCYDEAKFRVESLVLGKNIWLERDMQSRDRYNRSLRYIYLTSQAVESVNEILIKEGLAITYILLPNTKYSDSFYKSEEKAIEERAGCLWQRRSQYYDCVHVKELYGCPDDYVVLENNCEDITIEGWTLRNQGRSRYSFSGIFEKNSTIKITRQGWKTTHECIWNDYSDTIFLFDGQDKLVLRDHY